jgi:hypothetical protein
VGLSNDFFTDDWSLFQYAGGGLYFEAGYRFQRRPDSKFSFTPRLGLGEVRDTFGYKGTIPWQLNLGFRYGQFLAILGESNYQLGWQNDGWRVLVFYEDYGDIPNLSSAYGMSIRYVFKGNKPSMHTYVPAY